MAGAIELWQETEGRWRWAYKEDRLELLSNHPYATRDEATDAARVAYPDASIAGRPRNVAGASGKRPTAITFALMVLAVWRWYRRARSA